MSRAWPSDSASSRVRWCRNSGTTTTATSSCGIEIAELKDVELVDEDYDDVVDVVLLWWRDGDGDLFDALADALTPLADGGYIWLLTPKAGRPGHVEPSDIGETAPTAGLSQTSSVSAARDWLGTRLVAPKARR